MPVDDLRCDRRAHARLDAVEGQLTIIVRAFPHTGADIDYEGHRKSHEAMIKAAEAQERFWEELKIDIAKKGAIGLLVIIVGLAATGFLVKFGIWQAMVSR